jgi:hypothetical protein
MFVVSITFLIVIGNVISILLGWDGLGLILHGWDGTYDIALLYRG